ncbi:MAG: hypothetical protein DLM55_10230 [Acidimicrobiales bacterium]|nr:MAG: hypothetical protein DLM55_10230 [Acidimicrobiales bacterium]
MRKRKLTVNVDADLITALKVSAARSHRRDYEVVEEALRQHLGLQNVVDRIWAGLENTALPENEAITVATAEVKMNRAQRQAKAR